jgi:hypothetical protein
MTSGSQERRLDEASRSPTPRRDLYELGDQGVPSGDNKARQSISCYTTIIYDNQVKLTCYCLEGGSSFGAALPEDNQLR